MFYQKNYEVKLLSYTNTTPQNKPTQNGSALIRGLKEHIFDERR